MSGAGDWDRFAWVNEPVRWEVDAAGRLTWSTRPSSDFWRNTGGVVGADDGDAFLRPCIGDFSLTMRLESQFEAQYDQCGLIIRADGRNWLKAGIEVDGGLWFSVVETHENSDWSKQAALDGNVEFTVWRSADTLRVGIVTDGSIQLVRELVFDGPVAVGPYSCAPKGAGFQVTTTTSTTGENQWEIRAQAGSPGPGTAR